MESMANDLFMSWTMDPANHRERLLLCCESFLTGYDQAQDDGALADMHAEIVSALGVFRILCSSLVALLHPVPNHAGSSATDLQRVLDYSGDELCLCSLRDTLNSDEEQNYWTGLIDDLLTKGPATEAHMPKLCECTDAMSNIRQVSDNAAFRSAVDIVKLSCERRQVFKKEMRQGSLRIFDRDLVRVALALAEELTSPKSEVSVSLGDVSLLQTALQMFIQAEGVNKALMSLEKWKRLNGARLRAGGFEIVMAAYPADFNSSPEPEPSLDKFLSAVAELDFSSDASLNKQVILAVAWHLKICCDKFSVPRMCC